MTLSRPVPILALATAALTAGVLAVGAPHAAAEPVTCVTVFAVDYEGRELTPSVTRCVPTP